MALLALTAGLASASPAKQGGIFRLGTTGASTQVDPQVAYVTTAWWLEYATAAKLYNYPDKSGQAGGLLRPEVASGFAVSGDGRTYTFTIRKGFRFSDGDAGDGEELRLRDQAGRWIADLALHPRRRYIDRRLRSAQAEGRTSWSSA